MTKPDFNLIDEPWILASDNHGVTDAYSLTEVFARAHELAALSGETSAQDAAILRLLLGILHSVFPYTDEDGEPVPDGCVMGFWHSLWLRGNFPAEAVSRYFQQWHERFWLFHPEFPFYQVAAMDKGTAYKASKLVGELSESNNKLRLFQSRSGSSKNGVSYDEAARWLLNIIAFDDNSSKSTKEAKETHGDAKVPAPGAGWLGKLGIIYAVGANLFETLMLNFILTDDNSERWETGGAAWELEQPRAGERVEIPMPASQAALLSLQSRRVLLERSNGIVRGYRLLGGDFFQRENMFSEQMTLWRVSKDNKDVYAPRSHEPERLLWRDFPSIAAKSDGVRPPGIVRWIADLQSEDFIPPRQVRLRATGVIYGDQNCYMVTDIFDDMLSVNAGLLSKLGDGWSIRVCMEIELVEKIIVFVGKLAFDLAQAAGVKDGTRKKTKEKQIINAAKEQAYFRLDVPFREWLAGIDPTRDDMDDSCQKWRETASDIILRLGFELTGEAGEIAFKGRMVKTGKGDARELITSPKAYNKFAAYVRKACGK